MKSVWEENIKFRERESLNGNINADVLVIGGGIAGILTAYILKKKGINAVIIEAERICSGNTKNTTAKITSQHDIIYDYLIREFGFDKAIQYAMANEEAIKKYKAIIEEEDIQCDFKEVSSYIYSCDNDEELQKELTAAKALGIAASMVTEVEIPIKVKGALRFKNQARFNPLAFLKVLSDDLTIYEHTRALEIKDDIVVTDRGIIVAKAIVIATHYPIMNTPGYYFLRMHQERSYVVQIDNIPCPQGNYIGSGEVSYSFRTYNDSVLFGGNSHRTGKNEKGGQYESLIKAAKDIYPEGRIIRKWSAQDCMPIDKVPYIGQYSKETPNIFVATGFGKWGMTSSMVAADIISDMIVGNKNRYADIFAPDRFDLSASLKNMVTDGTETVKNFIGQRINMPEDKLADIDKGMGKIIEYEGKKLGAYKAEEGKVYFVSTKCPHLGCELKWNPEELSWDCPCHGSRFDYMGKWIESPAIGDDKNG